MWSIASRRPAMFHMKVCWRSKGGHKSCFCEGVAGRRRLHTNTDHIDWPTQTVFFYFCLLFLLLCLLLIQHPDIEIGRNRNWPTSKLAEIEFGRHRNWPTSKLAEIEFGRNRPKKAGRHRNWPTSKLAEIEFGRNRPKKAGRSRNWPKSRSITVTNKSNSLTDTVASSSILSTLALAVTTVVALLETIRQSSGLSCWPCACLPWSPPQTPFPRAFLWIGPQNQLIGSRM